MVGRVIEDKRLWRKDRSGEDIGGLKFNPRLQGQGSSHWKALYLRIYSRVTPWRNWFSGVPRHKIRRVGPFYKCQKGIFSICICQLLVSSDKKNPKIQGVWLLDFLVID